MSLDVYVMPLWRFKTGNVEPATQQVFKGESKAVIPQGIFSPQRVKSFFVNRKAKQQVRQIAFEAEKELEQKVEWRDEGNIVHSQQAPWGFQALRTYARWLDLQDQHLLSMTHQEGISTNTQQLSGMMNLASSGTRTLSTIAAIVAIMCHVTLTALCLSNHLRHLGNSPFIIVLDHHIHLLFNYKKLNNIFHQREVSTYRTQHTNLFN